MPNITYKGQVKLNIVNGNRGNFDQINVDSNVDDVSVWPGSVDPTTMDPPLIVISKARVDNLNADMLDGKSSSDFVQINSSNGGVIMGDTNYFNTTPPENGIIISGTVGIGTSSPSGILYVEGGTASSGVGKDITLNAQDGAAGSNGGDINLIPGTAGSSASKGQIVISGDIIPDTDAVYDIGKSDKRIRDIYVSESTVWFGNEFQLSVNEQSGSKSIGFRKRQKDNLGNFKIPRNIRALLGQNGAASGKIRHLGVDYSPETMTVHVLNDFMRANVTLPSGVTDPWQDTTVYDSQGKKSGDSGYNSGDTSDFQGDMFADISGDMMNAAWTRSGTTINYPTGNVYIGGTSGTDKLEVKGNLRIINASSNSKYVSFNVPNSASGTTYVLPDGDGSSNQYLKTNGSGTLSWGGLTVQEFDNSPTINNVSIIKFDSDSGLQVTDLGSNAVKIGIGSHWKNLVVSGQTTLSPTGQEALEFVAGSNITLTTDSSTTPKKITVNASGTLTASSLTVGNTTFRIIDTANGYIVFEIDGVEKVRISNNGYIGLGTNNPQAPIDIRSSTGLNLGSTGGELTITESSDDIIFKNTVQDKDLIFNINYGGTDTEIARFDGSTQSFTINTSKKLSFDGASSQTEYVYGDGSHLYMSSSGDVSFGSGNTQTMRLLSSGNLGVGTATPSTELEVNGTVTATTFSGALTGNVTGNTSGSSGSCTGNAATATEATNVTATANNSTNETTYLTFVDGATGTQGIETDTGLTYNPSSGVLTATTFTGSLTGNVTGNLTGNTSGSSGSCTGNSATATEATNVTAVANNSTNETTYLTFVDGATGTQGIETDTGLTYNPSSGVLTATTFTGSLTGNVTGNLTGNTSGSSGSCTGNATTATEATNVTAVANNSTNETTYMTFVDGATGTQGIETDTGLTYNPSSGVLTSTSFTGSFTGNASGSSGSCTGNAATATEATNVTAVANNSTNETTYMTFVDGATGTQGIETDTGLTYNPSSGVLTSTSFTGSLTGNASGSSGSCTGNAATATEATNVTAVANNSTDETTYLTFVDGATGTQGIETDTGLTYNPSSGILSTLSLRLSGSSSGYFGLAVPASAGSTTYTLPNADGTSGYALVTNGSGTLSWSQVGSTLTVREVDGSPSISNVSAIEFDQSSGLTVTDQGSNVARISLGSHWKSIQISGRTTLTPSGEETLELVAGSNMTLTTDSSSTPKRITFASSGGGSSLWSQNTDDTDNIYYTTGTVGIGITDPDQKLEVSGIIHVSGEQSASPSAPLATDGGLIYVKDDGKLYFRSATQSETDIATSRYMSSLTTKDVTFNTTSVTITSCTQVSPSGTTIVTSTAHSLSADDYVLITGTGDSNLDSKLHQVSSVTNITTVIISTTAGSNTTGGTLSKNYGDYGNTSNKTNVTCLDHTLPAGEHYILVSWTSKFVDSPLDDQILELYYKTTDYSSDTISSSLPATKLSTIYRSNNAGDYHSVTETIFVQVPVTQTYYLRWARSSRGLYDWGTTSMKLSEENFKISYVTKADIVAYRSQYQSKSITLKNNSFTISSSTVASEYTTITITADHSYATTDTLFITGTGDSLLDSLYHSITSLPDARNIRITTVGTSNSTGGTISQNYGNYTDTDDKYVVTTLDNALSSGDYQIYVSWTSNFIDNPLDDQILELYYKTSAYSSDTLTSTLPSTSNRVAKIYRSNSTSDFHTMTRSIYLQVPTGQTYYLRWARSSRGLYDWGSGSMNLNEETINVDYFSNSVVTSAKTDKVYVNDTKVEVTDTSSTASINMIVNDNQAGLLDNNVKFRLNSGSNTNATREFSITSGSSNYNLMTVWEGATTGNNGVGIELGDRNFTFSAASDSLVRIKASNSRGVFTDCVGMRTAGSNDNFVNFSSTNGVTLVGKIKLVNNTSVQYAETSDRRIKNNISLYSKEECYKKIKRIKVRKFRFNNSGCSCDECNTNVGFIAQELAEVELLGWNDKCNNTSKGWIDCKLSSDDKWIDDKDNVYKGKQKDIAHKPKLMDIDYGRVTPYLIGAIQKQAELIEELRQEIELLKNNK